MRCWLFILVLLPSVALIPQTAIAWPWTRDMMNQPSIKPQEGPMTPFPENSVPVGGYPTPTRDAISSFRLANPVRAEATSIAFGKQLYAIYCVPCHGESGRGDGPVGKKFPVPPMDLTNDFIQKQAFDSWIFATITFGGKLMPSYSNDLSPDERWHIVNYVRKQLVTDSQALTRLEPEGGS